MGYSALFWGFIFQFDLRINRFDLLPDFIGYLLFLSGFAKLSARSRWFERARRCALPLVLLSIPSVYTVYLPGDPAAWSMLGVLASLAMLILDLGMVYSMCRGIESEAKRSLYSDLARSAIARWQLYLASALLLPFFMLLGLGSPGAASALFIPLFLFTLFVLVVMLDLVRTAGRRL